MARMLLLAALAAVVAQMASASVGWDNCTGSFVNGFHPLGPANSVQICKGGVIAICYDADMVDPAFSAYYVTPAEATNPIPGREDFYVDEDLKTLHVTQASVDSKAFSDTWNRGHLAPNHLLSWTDFTKHQTFTMANVAPQGFYFNQHPWGATEDAVLKWIVGHNPLNIVTGIAYKNRANATRAVDNIAIPDYYFKVVCDAQGGQSVGFVGANTPDNHDLPTMMSVRDVEGYFGAQLFPATTCNTTSYDQNYWFEWSNSGPIAERKLAETRHQ
jgi:endonuclease G